MASVASSGASPLSGYEHGASQNESGGDTDDKYWTIIPSLPAGSSAPGSVGFFPSPDGGSLGSWALVDSTGQLQSRSSPGSLSPLALDYDAAHGKYDAQAAAVASYQSNSSYGNQSAMGTYNITATAGSTNTQLISGLLTQNGDNFMSSGECHWDEHLFTNLSEAEIMALISSMTPLPTLEHRSPMQPHQSFQHEPHQHQTHANAPALDLKQVDPGVGTGDSPIFLMEDVRNFSSPSTQTRNSLSASPPAPISPVILSEIKSEGVSSTNNKVVSLPSSASGPGTKPRITKAAPLSISTLNKSRIEKREKRRKQTSSSGTSGAGSGSGSGSESLRSASPESGASNESNGNKFLIVTPDSVNLHSGKPNLWECFEAMRPSQRGRKGPLASATKENALQVRRLGACFTCHARKVKCSCERPCKNCQKLKLAVPQVVCWQFQDFLPVLLPEFIRGHFRKDEMTHFVAGNVESFTIEGVEKPCVVELSSGARFKTTLTVRAKFFTPKTAEVLQHFHQTLGRNVIQLQAKGAAAIGLDLEGASSTSGGTLRDELKKKVREYIAGIVQEPAYADQVTDSLLHTDLPKKILRIVQNYSYRSDSSLVRRALSIYAMHYVMTRHLCLTRQTIVNLAGTGLVPQDEAWVTPRVLNRQLKAVVDEMLTREITLLFEGFSKSLKPKSRREWAPCLAAFLVLCLFMEQVEAAADGFVVTQNEIGLHARHEPHYQRSFALLINRELENIPFKQFTYQFHQIYQTHSKDTSASFNPLLDDACFRVGELDQYAREMVWLLRLFIEDDANWHELDYLTMDPILPTQEAHPHTRNVRFDYTGRLVAKFLLSFTDEKYIFGSN